MEGNYPVYLGEQAVGQVQVSKEGLYYHIRCKCRFSREGLYRMVLTGEQTVSMGILVPMGDGFGMDTRIPVKRIGEGKTLFQVIESHAISNEPFLPIKEDEPFTYIARLKDAYMTYQNGQTGIVLKENTKV